LGTPQLKKLRLYDAYLNNPGEVDELLELVSKKLILTKVKYLEWKNSYYNLENWYECVEYHYHHERLLVDIDFYFPDIDLKFN
jgi:hypothetical protein